MSSQRMMSTTMAQTGASKALLLKQLCAPIRVFDCAECGVDIAALQQSLAGAYADYEWDNYLLQQHKIMLIREALGPQELAAVEPRVWHELYHGRIADAAIPKWFPKLPDAVVGQLASLLPTRKRAISEYRLRFEGRWQIERIPAQPLALQHAMVADAKTLDFRVSKRVFKELPDRLFDTALRRLLVTTAERVGAIVPTATRLNVVVHHTLIVCRPHQSSSNSPEGIHQDGKDFIVSALVVERRNVSGGESIIYGADKETQLLRCELHEGQGIFHADAGTDLWHEVTPVTAIDTQQRAYRSTIGLDVTVME